jgi:battenin
MLLIALTPAYTDAGTISTKMAGVALASLSSGFGELSFLGLTHYYGKFSLAAWSSGTGGAGLIGAGAYALATTSLGMSVQTSLLASSFLPVMLVMSFFVILPRVPLQNSQYSRISSPVPPSTETEDYEDEAAQQQSLLEPVHKHTASATSQTWLTNLQANLQRSRSLLIPYMLPLLLVYIAEYTINQGVSPTLLFPISSPSTPFSNYRAFYPTYNAIYQIGVFLSRSSTPLLRIHNLYTPALLQVANLILLILQSLYAFIPNVWLIFLVVFWEGLLGGAVYVNTFAEILEKVPEHEREFSLGATSVSDSAGICVAGFLSLGLEGALCSWQVSHGKDWCTKL